MGLPKLYPGGMKISYLDTDYHKGIKSSFQPVQFLTIVCNQSQWTVREDSQIDFATGNVFCTLGGGGGGGGRGGVSVLHKNVSQILAIIDFFKQRNYRTNLVSKEENHRYITLYQTSCLNLDKFGIGNCISDCRSASFARLDLIFRVNYVSERTHFKLIIDFRLKCFQAGRWGLRETCK